MLPCCRLLKGDYVIKKCVLPSKSQSCYTGITARQAEKNREENDIALSNLVSWKQMSATAACGAACGASDKPAEEKKPAACGAACGAADKPAEEKKPAACGAACGAADKPTEEKKPAACGAACGASDR